MFHVHHVTPWSDGGRTELDNGVAVCPDCHLTARVEPLPVMIPRAWQREALPEVLPILRAGEFATINAAPGAGKTLFTGWVYRNLTSHNDVTRMVVLVPNTNLRSQWSDALKKLNIFLDSRGTTERRGHDGVVMTYHTLSDPNQVQQIIEDADDTPTLFVLDEVHHLAMAPGGAAGAWAVNMARIVGTVDRPTHPVLNLSGTLFRSKANEQITTIRYEQVGDQIETIPDYSVTAGRLIAERQLRHIKVLGFDALMKVEAVDIAASAGAGAEEIRAVDLDGDRKLASRVLGEMIRSERFLRGILNETTVRLGHASIALEGAPVKGLVVADGIEHAEQIYEQLGKELGPRYSFIAHGQLSSAEAEIERFRSSDGQAVMVAVQKITEGFDVPDICVLTYLRTWRAPLFINQMVGRAMRVTNREGELGVYLPATILVPNDAQIKAAFADVLVGAMQVLKAPPEPCGQCGREVCACLPRPRDKICPSCNLPWRNCVCICGLCGKSRHRGCVCPKTIRCGDRVDVEITGDADLVHVSIDGHDVDLFIIDALRQACRTNGLPEVFVEQQAASVQRAMRSDPMTFLTYLRGDAR